jgi:hypothetical protein
MSDYGASQLVAPASQLVAPAAVALAPDLERMDRNFRRVSQVEQSWQLPQIPDMVKTDLIGMPGADEDSLTEFLFGLDDVFGRNTTPEPPPQQVPLPAQQGLVPQQSGLDQSRIILASMTSNPPPTQLSENSVKAFKLRAIQRGMLDMDPRRVDNSWSPEFNRMRGEMAFDDYNSQLRGNRPLATSLSTAMRLLGDFTSPSGLLSMATELDFFWDFGQIGNEISSWGDKWRALSHAKNPLDWAGKLIDAATGPIDDIVFPIINVGLMFVGVGEIANFARVGWEGARLAQSAGIFSRLWEGGRIGRFAESLVGVAGRNLEELGNASMIANRLRKGAVVAREAGTEMGMLTRAGGAAGDALAAWRASTPVVATKSVVQQGMRLGFAGVLESKMPGYENATGVQLSSIPGVGAAGDFLEHVKYHPGWMPLELMFAPYNVFSPGTFFRHDALGVGAVSGALRGVHGALGTIPGRAVAGAAAGVAIGTMVGDDAGDIAKGAAIGAAAGAALPYLGRITEVERVHQGLTGALIGAAGGALLGDSPEDIALGAMAGVGMGLVMPNSVRRRFYQQAGVNGLNKLLRGVGHQMVRTNFQLIAADQEVMAGFNTGFRRRLLTDPDKLAEWDNNVSTLGVIGALAKHHGIDENAAAASIAFGYASFAADHIAAAQAATVTGIVGQMDAYHVARNTIIQQLRPINLERPIEDLIDEVAAGMAYAEKGGAGATLVEIRARADEIAEKLRAGPESKVIDIAETHNKLAGDTILQMFDQRNFPKPQLDMSGAAQGPRNVLGSKWATTPMKSRGELFADYVPNYFDSIGSWDKYTASLNDVRLLRLDDVFDAAQLKPVTTRRGKLVNPFRQTRKIDPQVARVNTELNNMLVQPNVDVTRILGLDALAGASQPGRMTLMRAESPTKQMLENMAEQVADVVETTELVRDMQAKNFAALVDLNEIDEAIRAAKVGDNPLTDRQIVVMAKAAAEKGVNKKAMRKLLAFADHHGIQLGRVDAELRRMADELALAKEWEQWGMKSAVFDEAGRPMGGVDALQRRLKDLRERIPYTAAEVDVDALIAHHTALETAEKAAATSTAAHSFSHLDDLDVISPEFEEGMRAAAVKFEALGDDDIVTLYHGTTRELADQLTAEGRYAAGRREVRPSGSMESIEARERFLHGVEPPIAKADGLAVSWSPSEARKYAGSDGVVLEVKVRKGDLEPGANINQVRVGRPSDSLFGPESQWEAVVRPDADFTAQPRGVPPGAAAAAEAAMDNIGHGTAPEVLSTSERLRQLKTGMDERGYKLVHGAEFLMPEDIAFHTPIMNDVTRRHLNSVTMGNFFSRRHPIERAILDDRRRRLAIVNELAKVGKDVTPDHAEVDNILGVLERWLRAEQDDVGKLMATAHERTRIKRTFDRLGSAFTPIRIDDLSPKLQKGVLRSLADAGIEGDEAMAIWKATQQFRNSEFQDMGLYGIEAYLRKQNVPASFLKTLGGTRYGERVWGRVGGQALTGAGIGAVGGALAADRDSSFQDRLKSALTGAAVGAGVAGGLAAGVNAADIHGLPFIGKDIIQRTESWKHAYLGDSYARLRDSMRFTLSPFFDLSRYTEGLFLAQTAAPTRYLEDTVDAAGVAHRAGERIVIPGNMSPRALRRSIAKGLEAKGETAEAANRMAHDIYESRIGEFTAAARRGGDVDAGSIEPITKAFRQVGILGFSPTDWMGTAFVNLRNQGLGIDEAYEAAKSMYNYGTRGRSAAEMSANFIMFPFSFQKKALGHMAKWLNDDLGRSIILHDALKTYERLDEEHNLDELWRDHIPWLTQLSRLNLFAYGISAGRFGGINSQLFEGVGKVAWNAFIPFATNIKDVSVVDELIGTPQQRKSGRLGGIAGGMLPVWNDINWMTRDFAEVAVPNITGLATPMAAESYRAQIDDGYDDWYSFKRDFETKLQEEGFTMNDVFNDAFIDFMAPLRAQYERKKLELQQRYPAWWQSRMEAPGNIEALNMEKSARIANATYGNPDGSPVSPDNQQVAEMQQFIDDTMEMVGLTTGNGQIEDAPAEVFDEVHRRAVEYARVNPGFTSLWNKFWRREWGLIESAMQLR